MISKEELREYAMTRKLNLGQAEKEYFQNILLFILYEQCGKELVFKGGTALNRIYGLERFSEDLDFTLSAEIDIRAIVQKGLERFYLDPELQEEKLSRSRVWGIRIKGPLFIGIRQSLCRIQLDFSLRENVLLEPKIITLGRLLRELPSFDVVVMAAEEILAEKMRAIMTRTKARDAYDLWFLLNGGTPLDFQLVAQKMEYYKVKFTLAAFQKNLSQIGEQWERELTPLLKTVPPFRKLQAQVLEKVHLSQEIHLGENYRQ